MIGLKSKCIADLPEGRAVSTYLSCCDLPDVHPRMLAQFREAVWQSTKMERKNVHDLRAAGKCKFAYMAHGLHSLLLIAEEEKMVPELSKIFRQNVLDFSFKPDVPMAKML